MKKQVAAFGVLLGLLLFVFACAEMQKQVPVDHGSVGQKTISVQASSFEFRPNNIKAAQGDTVLFTIHNDEDKEHNFTIKDPEGKLLQVVDLPPHTIVPVTVTFAEAGMYDFYCNEPLHEVFGMQGQVQAVPEQIQSEGTGGR